jgi:hypothetical protein
VADRSSRAGHRRDPDVAIPIVEDAPSRGAYAIVRPDRKYEPASPLVGRLMISDHQAVSSRDVRRARRVHEPDWHDAFPGFEASRVDSAVVVFGSIIV